MRASFSSFAVPSTRWDSVGDAVRPVSLSFLLFEIRVVRKVVTNVCKNCIDYVRLNKMRRLCIWYEKIAFFIVKTMMYIYYIYIVALYNCLDNTKSRLIRFSFSHEQGNFRTLNAGKLYKGLHVRFQARSSSREVAIQRSNYTNFPAGSTSASFISFNETDVYN